MAFKEVIDLFINFCKQNPTSVILNSIFLFLVPIQDVFLPSLYGKLMDIITSGGNFIPIFLIVISLIVGIQILFFLADFHDSKFQPKLQSFIQTEILRRVLDKYETEYTDLELGDIITKILKIPIFLLSWFERLKNYVIPYVLVYVFASIYYLFVDIQLGAGLICVISALIFVISFSPFACSHVSKNRDIYFNKIHEEIDDILVNLFSVYGANQKEYEVNRLKNIALEYIEFYKKTMECVIKMKVWVIPLIIIYLLFFVFRCSHLMKKKRLSSGQFISVFIILLYLLNSIITINDQIKDIVFDYGIIGGSSDIIELRSRVPKMPAIYKVSIPPFQIGMDNVTFSYPSSSKNILENFSLHINKGERVCLVGDIGSGKSSVLKLFLKYQLPSSGLIYVNGKDYMDIQTHELRKYIGYVPQQPVLFNRTIMENILYGNKTHTISDVQQIINKYSLEDHFSKFENGLSTVIGKNGSKLSGGQRQLIWCIRILLQQPEIIILDEPTASIDDKTKTIFYRMLQNILFGKTVIMVTHDPSLEAIASRVVKMKEGKIIDDYRKIV